MVDNQKIKLFIQWLEESLTSAERNELVNPLNKPTEICRVVLRMSASFPSLEISDNLHQSTNCVLENNIYNIVNILQFRVSSLSESDAHNIRCKLKEFLPELKILENIEMLDLEVDSECEKNILSHLHFIIYVMNNTEELLKCFRAAFFTCKQSSTAFFTQDFIRVSTGLQEIIIELESQLTSRDSRTGGNRFSVVLFSAFSRPLKIVLRAVWLLVTFPAIECPKFDVIFSLCQSAVCVFKCASGVLIDLTRFLLKDFAMLRAVRDELLQVLQSICDYCNQMLEEEPTDGSLLEELEIEHHYNISNETRIILPKPAGDAVSSKNGETFSKPEKIIVVADGTTSNLQGTKSNNEITLHSKPKISSSPEIDQSQIPAGIKRKFDSVAENTTHHILGSITPKVARNAMQTAVENNVNNTSETIAVTVRNTLQTRVHDTVHNTLDSIVPNPVLNTPQTCLHNLEQNTSNNDTPTPLQNTSPATVQNNALNTSESVSQKSSPRLVLNTEHNSFQRTAFKTSLTLSEKIVLSSLQNSSEVLAEEILTLSTSKILAPSSSESVAQSTSLNLVKNSLQSSSVTPKPKKINLGQDSVGQIVIQTDVDWLTPSDHQPVRNIAARIGRKINDFMLTTKPGTYKLRMACKICHRSFKLKSVENHISDWQHLEMAVQRHGV